ncbi:hypothetical protein ACOME3_004222 [Neoechinorhynchus agilis]
MRLSSIFARAIRIPKNLRLSPDAPTPHEAFEVGTRDFVQSLTSQRSRDYIRRLPEIKSKGSEIDLRIWVLRKFIMTHLINFSTRHQNKVTPHVQLQLGHDMYAMKKTLEFRGRAKAVGFPRWITSKDRILKLAKLTNKVAIESVDLSYTRINEDGLDIYTDCVDLKSFTLRNCMNVDDWFIAKLAYVFNERIMFLDISGCPNVYPNSLLPLCRLRNLRRLRIYGLEKNLKGYEYMVLELNEALPGCLIEGFSYDIKDEEIEQRRLKGEIETKKLLGDMIEEDPDFYADYVKSKEGLESIESGEPILRLSDGRSILDKIELKPKKKIKRQYPRTAIPIVYEDEEYARD